MIPEESDQLLAQGHLVVAGLTKHGASIGVEPRIAASLEADIKAYVKLDGDFKNQRESRKRKLTPEQQTSHRLAGDLIQQTKNVVAREFGSKFSHSWTLLSYTTNLRMPKTLAEREAKVEAIASFLADHPRFENEGLGVTAANAEALHRRLVAARSATGDGKVEIGQLSTARNAARTRLKKRLATVAAELKLLLPDDDKRWLAFGIKPPAEHRAALKAARDAKKRTEATSQAPAGSTTERPPAQHAPASSENGSTPKGSPLSA